jgi:hypothetical protein
METARGAAQAVGSLGVEPVDLNDAVAVGGLCQTQTS